MHLVYDIFSQLIIKKLIVVRSSVYILLFIIFILFMECMTEPAVKAISNFRFYLIFITLDTLLFVFNKVCLTIKCRA